MGGKAWIVTGALMLATLAGCGENQGWNPNYRHADTPYGRYLVQREAALTGQGAVPRVIPVTLPRTAPRPEEIGMRRATAPQATTTTPAIVTTPARSRPETLPASGYARARSLLARYAATVDNDPGQARFPRPGIGKDPARACTAYPTPEAAQIAFIARGGPQADPLGLDPDGDGFVCGWDPRPLREAGL